ncbi:MAG: type II toxin-antitoxin system Phd/YefM family antitoxin [Proteobacteria bacterium]|nr:type II toxin-antitoxin system Phd/YefM family antitoxin [Pseudomonadota bacterium]
MEQIHANLSVSISELKKNPTATIKQAKGKPVAILIHNTPMAYLVPADVYSAMLDILEDYELTEIVKERRKEKDQAISVTLDDL